MEEVLCVYKNTCPQRGELCEECRHNSNFTFCIEGTFESAWYRPKSIVPWDYSTTFNSGNSTLPYPTKYAVTVS